MPSSSSTASKKYRDFSSSGVQLVFWVREYPIAALLSFEHIWT